MTKNYIPDAGDIVWLQFNPQIGREQAGNRPALVLSPRSYNAKTHLMICCPITTKIKGYPFEVVLESHDKESAVLSDQIKSLDWKERKASFKEKCEGVQFQEVREKIKALLQF